MADRQIIETYKEISIIPDSEPTGKIINLTVPADATSFCQANSQKIPLEKVFVEKFT